jgi:peptidoglycan L-alanyl-D-glutamate endopeptidase CwlK
MYTAVKQLLEIRRLRFHDGRASNDEDSLTRVFETIRTNKRQQHIYGFGRDYDEVHPPRKRTNAYDASFSWHGYGLAVDVIHPTLRWNATQAWWEQLAKDYEAVGLRAGRRFKRLPDSPHAQWFCGGLCPVSPTPQDRADHRAGRIQDVWNRYKAA